MCIANMDEFSIPFYRIKWAAAIHVTFERPDYTTSAAIEKSQGYE
jgi:hypothetical protein